MLFLLNHLLRFGLKRENRLFMNIHVFLVVFLKIGRLLLLIIILQSGRTDGFRVIHGGRLGLRLLLSEGLLLLSVLLVLLVVLSVRLVRFEFFSVAHVWLGTFGPILVALLLPPVFVVEQGLVEHQKILIHLLDLVDEVFLVAQGIVGGVREVLDDVEAHVEIFDEQIFGLVQRILFYLELLAQLLRFGVFGNGVDAVVFLIQVVQDFDLQVLVEFLDQEFSDDFRDDVSQIAHDDEKVLFDFVSEFEDQSVALLLHVLLGIRVRGEHQRIVGEEVVFFALDDVFDDSARQRAVLGQNLQKRLLHFMMQFVEFVENLIDDGDSLFLENVLGLVEQGENGLLQHVQLGVDEEEERVERGETRNALSLIDHNRVLDVLVGIILGDFEALSDELFEEVGEVVAQLESYRFGVPTSQFFGVFVRSDVLPVDFLVVIVFELAHQSENQFQLFLVGFRKILTQVRKRLLHLVLSLLDFLLDFGQTFFYHVVEHFRGAVHQAIGSDQLRTQRGVERVFSEEVQLFFDGLFDGHVSHHLLLRAAFHAHVAIFQLELLVLEDLHGIGALVHQVDFGQNSQRPLSLRVEFLGETQGVGSGDVDVGRDHAQDQSILILAVFANEPLRDLQDVLGLVVHGISGYAGQVDEGQVGDVGGVDGAHDWVRRNDFTVRHLLRQTHDDLSNFFGIDEFFVFMIIGENEIRCGNYGSHHPQLQRPPRHYACSSG